MDDLAYFSSWLIMISRWLSVVVSLKFFLIQDKTLNNKTLFYLIVSPLLITFYIFVLSTYTLLPSWMVAIVADVSILSVLSVVMYKKGYSIKKSVILSLLARIIVVIAESVIVFEIEMLYTSSILILLTPILSLIFVYTTQGIRQKVNQSEELQVILLNGLIFLIIATHGVSLLRRRLPGLQEFIAISAIFLFGFLVTTVLSTLFFVKKSEEKYQIQRRKDEYEAMQYYTAAIEKHYKDMRKFKHDYQNIILSLNEYINEGDLSGLKEYLQNKVESVSSKMVNHDFMLENLSRIKIKEVKSILASKLMMASEKGVVTNFEAREDIEFVAMDTVVLVRMLGIILDNAIEELVELGEGMLLVGVWSEARGITFVIQNTCRVDTPKLYKLEESGFSTKGEKRGIGLSNLLELVEKEPNVLLQTSIIDEEFVQKITILESKIGE